MSKRTKREADEKPQASVESQSRASGHQDERGGTDRRQFLGGAAVTALTAGLFSPRIGSIARAAQASELCPTGCESGPLAGEARADAARRIRIAAADYERNMPIPSHPCNGDETLYAAQNFIGSFTKGLDHDNLYGEVRAEDYCALLRAIASGRPEDFENIPNRLSVQTPADDESRLAPPEGCTPEPPRLRRLESPQAGYNFDLEGKDYHQLVNRRAEIGPAQLVAFPPAYTFNSPDEAVEIIENYWQALTRDVPFVEYEQNDTVRSAADDLDRFIRFYHGPTSEFLRPQVTPRAYSRGVLPGDAVGPFVSQLMLRAVPYGAQTIPAVIRAPLPNIVNEFMTTFSEWLIIQNGRTPDRCTTPDSTRRFIRSGRDLAEYVRNDAIYQPYLNAALLLLVPERRGGLGVPLNPGNPYLQYQRQQNFVEFGPSQLLSLLGEVSVRAHKAVWYQKWQVHRRLRPEEFGARVHFKLLNQRPYPVNDLINGSAVFPRIFSRYGSYFLPQSYPEGSPLHPAYGAGHATLAGACVTILKAWFDTVGRAYPGKKYEATADGLGLRTYAGDDAEYVTVEGELNKLASNISVGRNIAGVHWRSDYTESVFLGEQVAIQLLEDYGFTYNESFAGFTFRDFSGITRTVGGRRKP